MMRVLIVDDEKSIRTTLQIFLERDGYEVETAETAMQALEMIGRQPCDILISDIIMPRMSGVEFLDEVKKILPDVPVLMMTGEPTIETAVVALQRGAFDYLNKPIQKEALLKAVRQAEQFRRLSLEKQALEQEKIAYQHNLEVLVNERTADLDNSMQSTIKVMTSLVDSRDPYTSGHQIRVGNLSSAIAVQMGLPPFVATGVRVTGYLHDIGKLAVPSEILVKPSRLSVHEFEMVKTHAEWGYTILSDLRLPWPIAEIVRQHHERLDGSGYPLGVKGDDIRLESRILTVADVVEAMASHRPYRPALGIQAAIDELLDKRGILFDPQVVDACLTLLKQADFAFIDTYMESSFIDEAV